MVFRGRDQHSTSSGAEQRLPFGQTTLDKACTGGVPVSGVLSIRVQPGYSEIQFLHNVIEQKAKSQKRIIWLHHRMQINPNWLSQASYAGQSWIVSSSSISDSLWACEQSVRSQACCCVVIYLEHIEAKAARRLQVLAKQYDCLVIMVLTSQHAREILPVNVDMALSVQNDQWFAHLHRISGAWPQQDIPVANPLPATNGAIIRAFTLYSETQTPALHDVS